MNCPHCQKALPENYGVAWCPHCGRELLPDKADSPPQVFEPNQISWPKFFVVLLAPAVCCFLALAVDLGGLAILPGLFGGMISGLICTRMIMEGVNLTGIKKAITCFGLAVLLCCLSYFLCFVGCISASTVTRHEI
jgi:hypothetical protein